VRDGQEIIERMEGWTEERNDEEIIEGMR